MALRIRTGRHLGKQCAMEQHLRLWELTEGADPRKVTYLVGPEGTRRWDVPTQQWVVVPTDPRRGVGP